MSLIQSFPLPGCIQCNTFKLLLDKDGFTSSVEESSIFTELTALNKALGGCFGVLVVIEKFEPFIYYFRSFVCVFGTNLTEHQAIFRSKII